MNVPLKNSFTTIFMLSCQKKRLYLSIRSKHRAKKSSCFSSPLTWKGCFAWRVDAVLPHFSRHLMQNGVHSEMCYGKCLTPSWRLAKPSITLPIIKDWDIRLRAIKLPTRKKITKLTTILPTRKNTSKRKIKMATISNSCSFQDQVITPSKAE